MTETVFFLLLLITVPAALAHILCKHARRKGRTPGWREALLAAFAGAGAFAIPSVVLGAGHAHGPGRGALFLLAVPMLIPAAITVACHQPRNLLVGVTGRKAGALAAAALAFLYLLIAFVIFDFNEAAAPSGESHFDGKQVAIGPRPWWWVMKPAPVSSGPDGYDANAWPFVIWKPVCMLYVKSKGYALPAAWR